MNNINYTPILKSKSGEFTALAKLNEENKNSIIPLFEITPLEWDQTERKVPRTLNAHLDSFCKKLNTKWPTGNCFIDPQLLKWNGQDNTDTITYIYENLGKRPTIPIPVIPMSNSIKFIKSIDQIVFSHNLSEFGLRLKPNDITSPGLESNLIKILNNFNLSCDKCHLILDFTSANFIELDNFSDAVIDILISFPFFNEWKSITLSASSFPSSSQIKEGTTSFARNDWKLYQIIIDKMRGSQNNRIINFSDYSIVHPEYFEFNPKTMSSSANIRYTISDKWVVVKGRALKKSEDYKQYKQIAKQIVDSNYYLGEHYSMGDQHLMECAHGNVKPGNPNVWNWVGNNHHFVKVLSDLSSNNYAFSNK